MTTIIQQYVNVRVTSTGMGQDGSDTVQYFNGNDWVDYLTVYQFEDNMKSKRDKTVDMCARSMTPKRYTSHVTLTLRQVTYLSK